MPKSKHKPTSIVDARLTALPDKLRLEWKMVVEDGVFVFPFDVLQVRLYCRPFPDFEEPRLIYPPLSRVSYTKSRGGEGSVGGGIGLSAGIGISAGWEITREAFRPGSPTEPEGERYGYYPLDLHLSAVRVTTDRGKVAALVEWPVERGYLDAEFRCWATFGYIVPTPGTKIGEYHQEAQTETYHHDPASVPEPVPSVEADSAPRVFISYQRDSEPEADRIRRYLEAAGFPVWQDTEKIRGTARWSVAVNDALHDTDRLILLETPQAMESDEVFNEWFFYYTERKPIHRLLLEDCEVHYQLVPFQYLDWRDPARRDWVKLVNELTAPFEWPSVARKEKVINTTFAPERTLPETLQALHDALLSEEGVVALSDEQLTAIHEHNPANEIELRLTRYAEWCGPRYQLDERFVRLTMYVDQGSKAQQRFTEHARFTDLRQVLAEEKEHTLVLLGDPGAGKSTLLRRLEMDTVFDALLDSGKNTLTFFVNLAEYGLGLSFDKLPSPFDWLNGKWESTYSELLSLDKVLHERRMLLLFDSLNEMPHFSREDLERRADLWRAFIYDYVRDRPGNRAIFACRTLDYGAVLSTDENPVPQIQLEPMTPKEVREYLANYAPEHAEMIWDSFEREPRLFELFRIPFMLQMLLDRVRIDGHIPQGRAETFNGFVYTLIARELSRRNPLFDRGGGILSKDEYELVRELEAPPAPYYLPEEGLLVPSLTALAYAMQEREPGEDKRQVTVTHADALKMLAQADRGRDIVRAGCAINVLDWVDRLYIRYYHQLIQEFFAARKLASDPQPELVRVEWHVDHVSPTLAEALERISDNDPLPLLPGTGWEETTVMAAAMTANREEFVRALMDVNLPLAARCAAAPDVPVSDTLRDEIPWVLVARTQDPAADLRARIAAGLALGEIGDPRYERYAGPYGAYLLPRMVPVDGGEYTIGSDDGLYDDEEPVHGVPIEPFEMAQFPVTNAEFALFIAAGGYEDEQWWDTDAAKAWRCGEGVSEGEKQYWRDYRKQRKRDFQEFVLRADVTSDEAKTVRQMVEMLDADFERELEEAFPSGIRYTRPRYWNISAYNNPAQPTVGVCWYEARAYCAWLSAQTGRPFRLPTEAEWEAAARRDRDWRYPYGPDFNAALGNTFENHIWRTTPVGVFSGGETPEGLGDLSGNVWEWTSTAYRPYPYQVDAGREDPHDANVWRVLRGGSWRDLQNLARCAARYMYYPIYRGDDFGFRVVCARPPSQ